VSTSEEGKFGKGVDSAEKGRTVESAADNMVPPETSADQGGREAGTGCVGWGGVCRGRTQQKKEGECCSEKFLDHRISQTTT